MNSLKIFFVGLITVISSVSQATVIHYVDYWTGHNTSLGAIQTQVNQYGEDYCQAAHGSLPNVFYTYASHIQWEGIIIQWTPRIYQGHVTEVHCEIEYYCNPSPGYQCP